MFDVNHIITSPQFERLRLVTTSSSPTENANLASERASGTGTAECCSPLELESEKDRLDVVFEACVNSPFLPSFQRHALDIFLYGHRACLRNLPESGAVLAQKCRAYNRLATVCWNFAG